MKEKKLITSLKNKDEKALADLIENYSGILKSVIKRVLQSFPDLWDECLNETLMAVWQNIDSYDCNRSSFKNWCASVARYKAIDTLRREVRHNNREEIRDENSYTGNEFDRVLVKEIFKYLSPEDRKLFEAIFIEGYTYDEMAQKLGVSKDALYSRVKRSRRKIEKEFGEGVK